MPKYVHDLVDGLHAFTDLVGGVRWTLSEDTPLQILLGPRQYRQVSLMALPQWGESLVQSARYFDWSDYFSECLIVCKLF